MSELARVMDEKGLSNEYVAEQIGTYPDVVRRIKRGCPYEGELYPLRIMRIKRAVGWTGDAYVLMK